MTKRQQRIIFTKQFYDLQGIDLFIVKVSTHWKCCELIILKVPMNDKRMSKNYNNWHLSQDRYFITVTIGSSTTVSHGKE